MMLLVMTFFGFLTQSIIDIIRGQVQISGLFIFDVLATILLNQFSILLQAQEYNSIGGSSFLFKLRFYASILLDSLCLILSMPLIKSASRYSLSEFGHGYGLCAAYSSHILFCLIIVSINNDNNQYGNIKYQNAAEIKDQLQNKDEDDTMQELLDTNHSNDMDSAISTRQSSEINNSLSSINTEDSQIKISIQNHIDVNALTRSKMYIRIHYKKVKVEDLQVSKQEIIKVNEESVVLYELNINYITDENKYKSSTIKRRWTEILLMKKELSFYLDPQVYESLPTIEDTFLCREEQLNEVSIKARVESLNQFLKELITLDAKLECLSNFFNKDQTTSNNEEFERNSFNDSKNLSTELSNLNDNISISENDTLSEMESVSRMSSASSNSVLIVEEDNTKMIPSGVIQQNVKLTCKYKFICPSDNVTYYCRIQLSMMEWKHEIKKSFKEIHLLWQFLKQHCDIKYSLRSDREVKKDINRSSYGEVAEMSDEDLDNVYEELRSEYEDFLQYMVTQVKYIRYKRVREFLQLPNDLNDLINV